MLVSQGDQIPLRKLPKFPGCNLHPDDLLDYYVKLRLYISSHHLRSYLAQSSNGTSFVCLRHLFHTSPFYAEANAEVSYMFP